MKFEELDEYKKDLARLVKKYKSLREDLLVVRKILVMKPEERPPFSFAVDYTSDTARIINVRKMACKSLKGTGVNSGLQLVYAYLKTERKIVMIALYDNDLKEDKEMKPMLRRFALYLC